MDIDAVLRCWWKLKVSTRSSKPPLAFYGPMRTESVGNLGKDLLVAEERYSIPERIMEMPTSSVPGESRFSPELRYCRCWLDFTRLMGVRSVAESPQGTLLRAFPENEIDCGAS